MHTTETPDRYPIRWWRASELLAALAATPAIRVATPRYPRHQPELAAFAHRPSKQPSLDQLPCHNDLGCAAHRVDVPVGL
jgi:hypothetical protein